jgi:UDP-glucuronate 4-epimerase
VTDVAEAYQKTTKRRSKLKMSKLLITGTAGFIGFHLTNALLAQGNEVIGLDNINDYYDIRLKYGRLNEAGLDSSDVNWNTFAQSKKWSGYRFVRMNLEDREHLTELFRNEKFDFVVHLAAQPGVRYSIEKPDAYIQSNIIGYFNILEACRSYPVKHLLYASSSSVYGNNIKTPFSEDDNVDRPLSLYAATKKSNELIAYTYSHLYQISNTGLRFFTVYGPWGRPDMAVFKFTESILHDKPIQVFGEGKLLRDFTYIDDIIDGIVAVLNKLGSEKPPMLLNIGNNHPVSVNTLVSDIEQCLCRKAVIEYLPMQPGDVEATFADISRIDAYCGFRPQTDLKTGIKRFCEWFLKYN